MGGTPIYIPIGKIIKYSGLVHAQPASFVLKIEDICAEITKYVNVKDIIKNIINADDRKLFSIIVKSINLKKKCARKILIHAAMSDKPWFISKIAESRAEIRDDMIIYKIFTMCGYTQSLVTCTSGVYDNVLNQMDVYRLQNIAAENGHLQCLTYLYQKHNSWFNQTHASELLNLTIENKHFECFEFIMDTNIIINPTNINKASKYGRVKYLEVICPKFNSGYECCNSTALLAAITNGHMNVIKYFKQYLNSWINVECVQMAISTGNVPMLKFITPYIIKLNDFESPIKKLQDFAILTGKMECYEYLSDL